MKKYLFLIAILGFVLSMIYPAVDQTVEARPKYKKIYKEMHPNEKAVSCLKCHMPLPAKPPKPPKPNKKKHNKFGKTLKKNIKKNEKNAEKIKAAIEKTEKEMKK